MNTRRFPLLLAALVLAAPLTHAAEAAPAHDMHAHMQKMHEQMAAIRAETDPARRAELMSEHHADMRAGMQMMGESTEGMPMEQRINMLEQRMGMMGMMMESMMDGHAPADSAESAAQPEATDDANHAEHAH